MLHGLSALSHSYTYTVLHVQSNIQWIVNSWLPHSELLLLLHCLPRVLYLPHPALPGLHPLQISLL